MLMTDGEVDGDDRRHDGSPGGAPAPPGERGREAPLLLLLPWPSPRWEKVSSSGPWCFWPPGGESLPRDWIWELSVSLSLR